MDNPTLRCKKSLSFGGGKVAEVEARFRMKAWLLAGHSIPDGPNGKNDHFEIDPMKLELPEEAELDRRAAALVAAG